MSGEGEFRFECLKKKGHYDTYYEFLFKEYITPWYWVRKNAVAAIYSDLHDEVEILKRAREKEKAGSKKSSGLKQPRSTSADEDDARGVSDSNFCQQSSRDKAHKLPRGVHADRPRSASALNKSNMPKEKNKRSNAIQQGQRSDSKQVNVPNEDDTIQKLEKRISTMTVTSAELTYTIEQKNQTIQRLQNQLKNARDEINDLTLRLSKIAGDKLRDNNPDIADLSDPNRPTKLGEMFSELYDNQWSDAFENLPMEKDDEKIRLLHMVMKDSFDFCEKRRDDQTLSMKKLLLQSEEDIKIPINLNNALKDSRKKLSKFTADNLAKEFSGERLQEICGSCNITDKLDKKVQEFGKSCAEISWLMLMCDPPMALSNCEESTEFSGSLYKAYTRSEKGMKKPVIDLVVWPALYLHEGGPLVSKGVAQPKDAGSGIDGGKGSHDNEKDNKDVKVKGGKTAGKVGN